MPLFFQIYLPVLAMVLVTALVIIGFVRWAVRWIGKKSEIDYSPESQAQVQGETVPYERLVRK